MSGNIVNRVDYLRTSRNFPEDPQALSVEVSKSYIDIANGINSRTIGLFPKNRPAITGERFFLTSAPQQTLRQVYTFTAAGNIPHGITTSQIAGFTRIYGVIYDGTSWYPLPYVDVVAANNQVSVKVTSTNIVITAGAGAPPVFTSGIIVLEWLVNV